MTIPKCGYISFLFEDDEHVSEKYKVTIIAQKISPGLLSGLEQNGLKPNSRFIFDEALHYLLGYRIMFAMFLKFCLPISNRNRFLSSAWPSSYKYD